MRQFFEKIAPGGAHFNNSNNNSPTRFPRHVVVLVENALTNSNYSYIVLIMNRLDTPSCEVFRIKCKEANLKVTPQRTIIYEALLNDKGHPSADAVFQKVKKKVPNISFDTVNRTLLSFTDIGLLRVVEGYGRPKRFDPELKSHHHFQCLKCNTIIDFSERSFDALEVPAVIKNKFSVTGKKVVLEGICGSCRG